MSHSIRREIVTVPLMARSLSRQSVLDRTDEGYHPVRMSKAPAPSSPTSPSLSTGAAPGGWPGGDGSLGSSGLDIISIRNLRAWTLIGVHPHEREMRQEIRIDAWLGTDISAAAESDALADAIDYAAVSRAFREHAGAASHKLIETLIEELATLALETFGALAVRITVEKPGAVPGADTVGVTIERPRRRRGEASR